MGVCARLDHRFERLVMRSIRRPDDSSCTDCAPSRARRAAVPLRRAPVVRVAATVLLACAAALALEPPAAEAAPKPLLSSGSTGAAVKKVQRRLGVRADGLFGPVTQRAVIRFQRRHGVPATGMVGPLTRRALRRVAHRAAARAHRRAAARLLSVGDRGRAVRRVQRRVGVRADGVFGPVTRAAVVRLQRRLGVAADGMFGPVTRAAVIRFQRRHGVPATGMVGPLTRRALRRASHRGAVHHTAGRRLTVGRRAVRIARRYLGVPYRWGGASPGSGFDCSGLVMYVYAQLGVGLPHYTVSQYRYGRRVRRSRLRRGDLVFFNGLGHVGIYIGHNRMIHAPSTGQSVKISRLTGWYAQAYVGARRVG
jgi:peptidoglycan hydrolase-like protein with peptidoglycan-binding domain